MDLKSIQNNSHLAWWEWNIIEDRVEFNDLKATMLGYDPRDFRGKGFRAFTELLHRDDYDSVMEAMRIVLRGESDLYLTDYRIRAVDGTYRWYMDRGIVKERDSSGNVLILRGLVVNLGYEKNKLSTMETLVSLLKKTARSSFTDGVNYVTLCSQCKRIRTGEEGSPWISTNREIEKALTGILSHGICRDCLETLYPEIDYKDYGIDSLPKGDRE